MKTLGRKRLRLTIPKLSVQRMLDQGHQRKKENPNHIRQFDVLIISMNSSVLILTPYWRKITSKQVGSKQQEQILLAVMMIRIITNRLRCLKRCCRCSYSVKIVPCLERSLVLVYQDYLKIILRLINHRSVICGLGKCSYPTRVNEF